MEKKSNQAWLKHVSGLNGNYIIINNNLLMHSKKIQRDTKRFRDI